MKILCIGHATYDITYILDNFVIENTKNRVKNCVECGGGSASNAAYLLGKWGMDVYFAGIVGNDFYGNKIKEELESVNVNTDYIQISNEFKTTVSTIIVNKGIGSRTILTYKPESMKMKEFDLGFEPDVILLDGQEYEMSKLILKKYPKAVSIIDAGRVTEEILELSGMVDYLICSKNFAEEITKILIDLKNINTISSLYLKLKQTFNNQIIVTLENTGALYEINHKIKIMKSLSVKTADTTGAGDIFHGAFVYGVVQKLDLEDIIKISNITAALSVTEVGGRLSIPSKEKMKLTLNEY